MRLVLTCWLVLFSVVTSNAAGFSPRIGFGRAVDGAGDVNGDGFDDVIVGAPSYNHPEHAEGAAFVYFGAASAAFAEQPDWQVELDEAGASSGRVVAGIGDVNNDGYDDVLVASPVRDNPATTGVIWRDLSRSIMGRRRGRRRCRTPSSSERSIINRSASRRRAPAM